MQNRAKIFMPFDALNGLKEAIKREELLHEKKFVKTDNITEKLKTLRSGDIVKVLYFYNFEYINFIGQVKEIDYKKEIIKVSNSVINFADIDEIKKRL